MEVEQYIILPTGLIRHFFLPFTEAWGMMRFGPRRRGEVRVDDACMVAKFKMQNKNTGYIRGVRPGRAPLHVGEVHTPLSS